MADMAYAPELSYEGAGAWETGALAGAKGAAATATGGCAVGGRFGECEGAPMAFGGLAAKFTNIIHLLKLG